jgi:hypothetical protein
MPLQNVLIAAKAYVKNVPICTNRYYAILAMKKESQTKDHFGFSA